MDQPVRRWDSDREGEMMDAAIEKGPGEYVLYADYSALQQSHERLLKALKARQQADEDEPRHRKGETE